MDLGPGEGERWEALFSDLEAGAAEIAAAELRSEVADRTRREYATLRLVDRLRPATGHELQLRLLTGDSLRGRLVEVGADWILLVEPRAAALVPLVQVAWVTGLGARSAMPGSEGAVTAALDLRHALRRLARDRAAVVVSVLDGSTVSGTVDRVGADFVEVAEHAAGEPRRAAAVRQVRAIALTALSVVRSG